MGATGWVATLTLLLAVPVSIWLALAGHNSGLYGYGLVPVVFGAITVVVLGGLLFGVLPKLNSRDGRREL